jgi:hypothetical protein
MHHLDAGYFGSAQPLSALARMTLPGGVIAPENKKGKLFRAKKP